MWVFSFHILLKSSLENFEHCFASMWNKYSCVVVWILFGIALLWDWNENRPFPVLWPLLSFPNLLAYSVKHFDSITFYLTKTDKSKFSSVQSLSRVWLFATPWIAACQASLSITNSRSSLRLTSVESVTPSNHLILCRPLLLLLPIPPSIRVFSNESTLCTRWPKYWSFSFSIILSKEYPGLISFRMY